MAKPEFRTTIGRVKMKSNKPTKTKKAMKTMKKFLSMAALALVGAMMTGCSSDDNFIDQQPANNGKTVTLTMSVGLNVGGETRALAADGTKTFAAGEKMAVIYKKTGGATAMAETVALKDDGDITNSGKTATFTVTLDDPDKTQNVTYVYPAAMVNSDGSVKDNALAEQDGTLSSLASNLDYCTNSGAWDNGALPELTLDNQFAILAITLKDTDGSNDITDTFDGLTIEDGTNTYNVTRTKAAGPIYVAIRPTSAANIEVTAYDGPVFYPKSLTAKTYEASNGYSVSWKMTRGGIDLARIKSENITVTAQDGDIIKGTLTADNGAYNSDVPKVQIADGASVTLSGATINRNSYFATAALICLGDANIDLVGTNTLNMNGMYGPGILVPSEKTLTIDGSGSLTATGGADAAGIGGKRNAASGNITINGGTVTATGGSSGAGIGGGFGDNGSGASCGNITINGGTVTATGGGSGAGIGSGRGSGASCGNITINGGTVNATGGNGAAGIGSGYDASSSSGSISITGGNVTATGYSGAGIGSGNWGGCGSISITGGTVNATSNDGGAGIGSGRQGSCGTVTITDGVTKVTARKGTNDACSIGAGDYGGRCGTVTIGGVEYPDGITDSRFVYPIPAPDLTWDFSQITGTVYLSGGYNRDGVNLRGSGTLNFSDGSLAKCSSTFTAPTGKKFWKIVVSSGVEAPNIQDWTRDNTNKTATWTGSASNVSIIGSANGISSIVFYLEDE